MTHPVLEKIDQEQPYFTRSLIRRRSDGDQECALHIWLPVQMDNGGWVSAVRITGLDLPSIAAMPGDDPLAAVLGAVTFARDAVDRADGEFLFSDVLWQGAGLPLSLNRGFPPEQLAELETQATALANEAERVTFAQSTSGL